MFGRVLVGCFGLGPLLVLTIGIYLDASSREDRIAAEAEEAIRAAMAEFSADLGDLDIEILAQGSRGILGVGRGTAGAAE